MLHHLESYLDHQHRLQDRHEHRIRPYHRDGYQLQDNHDRGPKYVHEYEDQGDQQQVGRQGPIYYYELQD